MLTRIIRSLALPAVVSLAWSQTPLAATADDVEIHETRPLEKLVFQLTQHSNLLITYEEAPYDEATELLTDTYANGRRFRYPAWKPITFHGALPHKDVPKGSDQSEKASGTGSAVAESAVAEYNASGNPGKFRVIRDGDYVHIVPAGRRRSGRIEAFEPVLDTKVTFTERQPRPCGEVLKDLIAQIKNLRGVQIVDVIPTGGLTRLQCRIEGVDLTARDAFKQFLQQMEAPQQNPIARFRYSWGLGYDANEDLYFLKIDAVSLPPDPQPAHASPRVPDSANNAPINGTVYGTTVMTPK